MPDKYRLTSETKVWLGRTLYRIEALISFGVVKAGDKGGWIESESNLSQEGEGWVGRDAIVAKDGAILGGNIWGGTIEGGTILDGTILDGTILGGTIRGGNIWGGTIRGGTILGGNIWGGNIWGGTIDGGNIRGGTILGGTILGGNIWGGNIRGGTIRGGTIDGGTIRDGTTTSKDPIFISGLPYSVTVTDAHILIGCALHTIAEWRAFNDRRILEMDGKDVLDFWRTNRDLILGLCVSTGRLDTVAAPEAVEVA